MRIGVATDHGGFELKENLSTRLRNAGHEVTDFGAHDLTPGDDYPDFSAKQGVEDDNLNVLCLGGRIEGPELAWDLVQTFLAAKFSKAPRHVRRLAKVAALENQER